MANQKNSCGELWKILQHFSAGSTEFMVGNGVEVSVSAALQNTLLFLAH